MVAWCSTGGRDPQAGAAFDLPVDVVPAELIAKRGRCADDERLQVHHGPGARTDGTLTGGQQRSDGFAGAAPAGLGQMLSGERFASSPVGVEDVGLGTVAAGEPLQAVDLNHPLALFEQMRGQRGAEAVGALDRPTRRLGSPPCWRTEANIRS
jgi:hypothetical protein